MKFDTMTDRATPHPGWRPETAHTGDTPDGIRPFDESLAPRRVELKPSDDRYLDLLGRTLTASVHDESAWRRVDAESTSGHGSTGVGRRIRAGIRRRVIRELHRRGLALVRTEPFDPDRRAHGADQPMFGFTMAGARRLDHVRTCVEDVIARQTPGDLFEAGVWRGGTSIWMRALLRQYNVIDRTVWLADSFEGLPETTRLDDGSEIGHPGQFEASLPTVKRNFDRFGLLDGQVRFLPGWFGDTLPLAPVRRIAMLRVDGRMYQSTMDALVPLYDRISRGGWVIVDDYCSNDASRAAANDFLASRGLSPDIRRIDWTAACWRVGSAR